LSVPLRQPAGRYGGERARSGAHNSYASGLGGGSSITSGGFCLALIRRAMVEVAGLIRLTQPRSSTGE